MTLKILHPFSLTGKKAALFCFVFFIVLHWEEEVGVGDTWHIDVSGCWGGGCAWRCIQQWWDTTQFNKSGRKEAKHFFVRTKAASRTQLLRRDISVMNILPASLHKYSLYSPKCIREGDVIQATMNQKFYCWDIIFNSPGPRSSIL